MKTSLIIIVLFFIFDPVTSFASAKGAQYYIDLGVIPSYNSSTVSGVNGKPLVSYSDGVTISLGREIHLFSLLNFFAELSASYHFITVQYRSVYFGNYMEIEDFSGNKSESSLGIGLRTDINNNLIIGTGVSLINAEYTSNVIVPSDISGGNPDPVSRENTVYSSSYFLEAGIGFKISKTVYQLICRVENYHVNNIPNFNNQSELGLRASYRLRFKF